MRTALWYARLEVLHRLLKSRRAWLTIFPRQLTNLSGPAGCGVIATPARRLRICEQAMQHLP